MKKIFIMLFMLYSPVLQINLSAEKSDLTEKKYFIGLTYSRYTGREGFTVKPLDAFTNSTYFYHYNGVDFSYKPNNRFMLGFNFQKPEKKIDREISPFFDFGEKPQIMLYKNDLRLGDSYSLFLKSRMLWMKFDLNRLDLYLLTSVGKHHSLELKFDKIFPYQDSLQNNSATLSVLNPSLFSPESVHYFQKSRSYIGFGAGLLFNVENFFLDITSTFRVMENFNPTVLINANYFGINAGPTLTLLDIIIGQEIARKELKRQQNDFGNTTAVINFSLGYSF